MFPQYKNRIHLDHNKKYKDEMDLPKKRITAVYLVAVLGMFLVVLSQFTNLYYYIDAQNYYHRNPGYVFSVYVCFCNDRTKSKSCPERAGNCRNEKNGHYDDSGTPYRRGSM